MIPGPRADWTWIGQIARGASLLLLGYWGLFAVLAPVTVWDSHVYNLGRIPLAETAGLFSNPLWTSPRQLAFPWTFDIIHRPLLHLGWGFGLPSFLSFVSVVTIAWLHLKEHLGRDAAWLGVLSLMAMPTLIFQAVGTKNDIAVLFGLTVWFHAFTLWRREQRAYHLFFMALALAFAAGAKTSGIPPAGLCALFTLWTLRRSPRRTGGFVMSSLLCALLFGSGETYAESARVFGSALGPAELAHTHRNNDGIRGAAANFIRYAFGNTNIGLEQWQQPNRVTPVLEVHCLKILRSLGLSEAGYRNDFSDETMRFIKGGSDASSDFGPMGTCSLAVMLLAACWWRPREIWWQLAAAALVTLGIICGLIAWMPWNNRFLVVPFFLATLASVSLACDRPLSSRWLPPLLLVSGLYGAITYPLTSFNKTPRDLLTSVQDRPSQTMKERPETLAILESVNKWRQAHPNGILYLLAGSDSWVLPFIGPRGPRAHPIRGNELETLLATRPPSAPPLALLVLNRPDFQRGNLPLTRLARFPRESNTAFYSLSDNGKPDQEFQTTWVSGFHADGWTAPEAILEVENWPERTLQISFWNPTPLPRRLRVETSTGQVIPQLEFAPDARLSVTIQLLDTRTITIKFEVDPAFEPGRFTASSDQRKLGLRPSIVDP